MTFRSSMIEPGQPCVISSCRASPCGERSAIAGCPLRRSQIKWGSALSVASAWSQSQSPTPVLDERVELRQLDVLGAVAACLLVREARRPGAAPQLVDLLLRHFGPEG